jgi:hypothetical protein
MITLMIASALEFGGRGLRISKTPEYNRPKLVRVTRENVNGWKGLIYLL